MRILTLLSVGLICSGADAQDYRTFSSSDGTFSIRAALIDLETDKDNQVVAVLKRQDTGKTLRVKLARLSEADRSYVGFAESIMSVPAVMRGRLTPGARNGLREKYGSDLKCEAAVDGGLRWLSQKQNADGSWGNSHAAGMTGLALMAFAGQGHGPLSPQYGVAVKRGTAWLVETAKKNREAFAGIFSTKPAVVSSTYEHAIATQALAEVYALSRRGKDALLPGEVVRQAGMIIIKKQTERGSWGYKDGIGYDPHDGNDLSVSGWQIHALEACRDAGMKIDGMDAAFTKAGKYLQSKQTADGGFGNPDVNQHYNQWNLSGAALSALQSIGQKQAGPDKTVRWMSDELKKQPLAWNSGCYLYTWYYNSTALHQAGGAAWQKWRAQCEPPLLANQSPEGWWNVEGVGKVAAAGSEAAGGDKDIYRACLATLILETPYRFLRLAAPE